ncbi:MAG: hypothetical protein EU544_02085 [Promethearchaeota archaeon]|nr:MAG: hypothetical protein EU544_02085 [Candidatus Lokiarchaeota archaeon]
MKEIVKDGEIVATGQYLGVVEQFLPDKRTTFVKDGEIYATKTGMLQIDKDKRELEIKTHQEKERKTVRMGDIVIGTLVFLRKYSVGITFYIINRKLHFNSSYFGNIHVSNISNRYIKKIEEAFQKTDILRAKVSKQEFNEYELTTVGKNLGVIHADCSRCGTTLERIGFNKLRCPFCGNLETRKLAEDYGDVSSNLIY